MIIWIKYKSKSMLTKKCRRYQEDYEKLLELKQEFDAALSAGEKKGPPDGGFTEAKKIKDKISMILLDLDRETKAYRQVCRMYSELGMENQKASEMARNLWYFDRKNKKSILGVALSYPHYTELTQIPDNFFVADVVNLSGTSIKTVHNLSAVGSIAFALSKLEEIRGYIRSGSLLMLCDTPVREIDEIQAGNYADLDGTINLTKIKKISVKGNLRLNGTGLKKLPEDIYVGGDIYISANNKELIAAAQKLKADGKIKGSVVIT